MENLSEIATKDLVMELLKREGVDTASVTPYSNITLSVKGPAIVLVVTD